MCASPHLHLNTSLTIQTAQYDSTLIKLSNAETQIEDLKLQLDDALGAEEMLVQLTERNLMLSEVCRFHFDVESDLNSLCRKSRKCGLRLRTWKH
jgi:hypothetical protein